MKVLFLWLLLLSVLFSSVMGRTCTQEGSISSVRYRSTSYQVHYTYYYSCGFLWLGRCSGTRSRAQYRTVTRMVITYRTECCSGYTCSTSCRACCSPSCRNGGSCDTPNRCICRAGWEGSYCQNDTDECLSSNSCDRNAVCSNTRGSYTCSCSSGYEGSGRNCTDIDECIRRTDSCSSYAMCRNTVGNYTCTCIAGYRGNGQSCYDINECIEGSDRCDVNATCSNTAGSYYCSCSDGYTGSGYYCNDIDECQMNIDNCSVNAVCTNTEGSYECTCNMGYQGTGINCSDIDECANGNGRCSQICNNTMGTYICSCREGYYLSLDDHTCEDINECNNNNGGCQDICQNIVGSYICLCNDGYPLNADGHTCEVPPPSPTNVIVSSVGKRSATVTWDYPVISFLNTLTEVTGYRVVARQSSFNMSDVIVNILPSQTSYIFNSSLEEFTLYQCEVSAKNSFGYGSASESLQFKTLPDVPSSPPSDVYAVVQSSTMIWLHWSPPSPIHVNGRISFYTIKVHEMETGRNWSFVSIGTVLRIGSLHPYFNYSLNVAARTFGNGPYSTPIFATTLEDAPTSHPGNVNVFGITSRSFTIAWSPVPYPDRNGIIRYYTVTLHEVNSGKVTNTSSNFTTLTISQLHPYYQYECKVKAKTIFYGPYSTSVTVRLDEEAPSGVPVITAYYSNSTSLFLQWEPPGSDSWNGVIREYFITMEEEISGIIWTYRTSSTNITILNLHPYYVYISRVHAFTVAMGPPSDTVHIRTLEEIPAGPPINISLLESTSTSLTFFWEEPRPDLQNGIITSYSCRLYELDSDGFMEIVDSNTSMVTIANLYPHSGYIFQVAAINSIGTGPFSYTFLSWTDEDAPGEAPFNVTIEDIGMDYAEITWDPPSYLHNGIIRYYIVEIRTMLTNTTIVLTTASLSATLVNLHPYINYTVSIAGHTIQTGPSSEPINLQTLPDVPSGSPIELGYHNITSNSIFLIWKLPNEMERNGEILEYMINLVDLSDNNTQDIFQVTMESLFISDLEPFSYYSYSVAAATVVGYGPFSHHHVFRTDQDVPSVAPSDFTGYATSSTSIFLSWSGLDQTDINGILQGYQVNVVEVETAQNFTSHAEHSQHTISLLHPYYSYVLSVAATTVGNGPFSSNITIRTHPDVPASSPKVLQMQSTSRSIYLRWTTIPASDQNGIITGYTVYLTDLDDGGINYLEFMTDDLNITLYDLIPYTTYGVMLSAHTVVGEGPQSNLSFIQTKEEAPIGQPTNITAVTFDATSIHIYWTHPPENTHYGVIREYKLNVTELETGNLTRLVVNSEETEVILRSLHPYYTYHITIVPVTIDAGDNYTEITIRTAEEAPSAPPSGLMVSELLSRSALIEWNPPAFKNKNGIIRKYIVNVTGSLDYLEQNVIHLLSSHNSSLYLSDLHPNTNYSISVSAFTVRQGPFSASLEIKTPSDIPTSPPQNISVSALDSRTIIITWQPPILEGQNGQIINYRLSIRDTVEMEREILHNINGNLLQKIIHNLLPFHVYSLNLSAGTSLGFGPDAGVLIEMPEDAPTHHPLNVQVTEIGIHNISLMWEPPPEEFHNGLIRLYMIKLIRGETELSFTVPASDSQFMFLHLHPYYTYNITVAAVTVAPGSYSPILSATTLETAPSSPPVNLTVTDITPRRFGVIWDPPVEEDWNGRLQEYTIILNEETEYTTEANSIIFESLSPYTDYRVIIAASTQEGIGPFTEIFQVRTEEDAPAVPPNNITVTSVLPSSFVIRWSSPDEEYLNGELSRFIMRILEEDTGRESYVTSISTSYTLQSLHPYYRYHISVAAVTNLPGPYSDDVIVRTLEDAPTSPPANITTTPLSSVAINVKWNLPQYENRNGIVRQYSCHITARHPWINISQTIQVNGTQVNLTNLIPHTTYYIRVQAITVLPGPYSLSQLSTTWEAAPTQPPVNVSVVVQTSTEVEVTWNNPSLRYLNGDIRYFEVVVYEKSSSSENYTLLYVLQIKHSPTLIEDLHPFYSYAIKVAAKTVDTGPYSETITWNMPEDAPSSSPSNIVVRNVSSSEIFIQWGPPLETSQNGLIRGYFIQIVNTNTEKSNSYNLPGNVTFLSVSGLHPAHTYVIDMAAITIFQGPLSDDIFVTMDEDVPSGPPEEVNVRILNSTHIEAIWHPPMENQWNGIIISYTLNISTSGQLIHQLFSYSTRTLLPLLRPYQEHSISVAANTQVGTGPFTTPIHFNTPETAPAGVPRNISVTSLTPTSFICNWLLPHSNITNGLVRHFIVKITENETNTISEVKVYGTVKEFVGLHPYYIYFVEVAAYTVGLGPYSQRISVTTLESGPSSTPRAITISEVGTRHFSAVWEPPEQSERNGVIRHYRINLWKNNSVDAPRVVFTTDSFPSISISSVLPYRTYFLSIAAITNEQGPESSPIVFQTLEDVPTGAPLQLQVVNVTSTTIMITWLAPEEEEINGILRQYHISVSEVSPPSHKGGLKIDSSRTWLALKDLDPYTVYEISVSGITIDEGPAATIQVNTAQEAPGLPPQSVTAHVHDSHSMTVTWRPPGAEQNGIIIGYNVNVTLAYVVDSTLVQHFTNSTSLYLSGLMSYSTYHIEVAAVTVAVGPYSDFIYAVIPEAAPSMAPQNFSVTITSSTSIHMSWRPPPDGHINGVLRSYYVVIMSLRDSTVVHSDNMYHETFEATIVGLRPFFNYTCSVSAVTIDDGPSANMTIQMPIDLPSGPPMSLKTILSDNNTLVISWKEPPIGQQNGFIINYVLQIHTVDTNDTEIFTWAEMTLELSSLHPYYTYEIMLAASTTAGVGPYTDPVYILMPPSKPSCTIDNITTIAVSTSSVLLSWMPPSYSCWNGIISNYTISIQSLGPQSPVIVEDMTINLINSIVLPNSENLLKNDPDPKRAMLQGIVPETLLISHLQPFFKYIFAIYMSNVAGVSNSSSSDIVLLPGREPTAPPSEVKIQVSSSTSIDFSWKPPEVRHWNGVITGYIVLMYQIPSMVVKEYQYLYGECLQTCTIKELTPHTSYIVEVAALSDFGIGVYSNNFTIKTVEDVPGHPLNLTVKKVGSSFVLSWKPPSNPNGVILEYEAVYHTLKVSSENKIMQYSNKTKSDHIVILNTEPQDYKFKVRARTKVGYGQFSNEVVIPYVDVSRSESQANQNTKTAFLAIGWMLVPLIIFLLVIGITIKRLYNNKRNQKSKEIEMTPKTEWNENQLYQNSETVEQRLQQAGTNLDIQSCSNTVDENEELKDSQEQETRENEDKSDQSDNLPCKHKTWGSIASLSMPSGGSGNNKRNNEQNISDSEGLQMESKVQDEFVVTSDKELLTTNKENINE